MWWKGQNLDKPLTAMDGSRWEFRVWHVLHEGHHIERIYFWNEEKEITGMLEVNDLHINKIKDRIRKLANDKTYRDKYLMPLKFPLENYY